MIHDPWPDTAAALMRSRFTAYKCGDLEWVRASWHPDTCPADLDMSENPRWRGLQIVDTVAGEALDTRGIVEFRATYLGDDGSIGVLHERSRFVKHDGRWVYSDGDIL